MVIARKVEFQKLWVFKKANQWVPTPDELEIFGGLFNEYNDFCIEARQTYNRVWVNKDSNHSIFDVTFDKVVAGVKYELTASIFIGFGEPNDRFNCHFYISRYERLNDVWLWKENLCASTNQVGTDLRVEDVWVTK